MHPRSFSIFIGILFLAGLIVSCTGLRNPRRNSDVQSHPPTSTIKSPDEFVQSPSKSEPVENNASYWAPQPGDEKLSRGETFINEQQILVMESYPPQFLLTLKGALPTPCHELRVAVNIPEEKQRVDVEVYSLVDPGEICIQVLEPFEAQVPLKGLTSGQYVVYVNGNNSLASLFLDRWSQGLHYWLAQLRSTVRAARGLNGNFGNAIRAFLGSRFGWRRLWLARHAVYGSNQEKYCKDYYQEIDHTVYEDTIIERSSSSCLCRIQR
jgi:hypothetical protein